MRRRGQGGDREGLGHYLSGTVARLPSVGRPPNTWHVAHIVFILTYLPPMSSLVGVACARADAPRMSRRGSFPHKQAAYWTGLPDPHLQQGILHEERFGPQEERCGERSGWPRHASSTLKFMNCPLRRQLPLSSAVGAIRSNSLRGTFRHSFTFLAGSRRKVRLITLLCAPSQRANYFLPELSLLLWCSRTGMRQSGLCASNNAS